MGTSLQTINAVATLRSKGGEVLVEGPIQCEKHEMLRLRVTVSQRTTRALAEGNLEQEATGRVQCWEVVAKRQHAESFEEGPGEACVLATTWHHGTLTDVAQWRGELVIMEET